MPSTSRWQYAAALLLAGRLQQLRFYTLAGRLFSERENKSWPIDMPDVMPSLFCLRLHARHVYYNGDELSRLLLSPSISGSLKRQCLPREYAAWDVEHIGIMPDARFLASLEASLDYTMRNGF